MLRQDAVASAFAVGLGADLLGLAPATLDLPALDMVKTRLAPSVLAVAVGFVAGGAAAVSLTAESGFINIVGVMIAAALIPAAAVAGLAFAWGYPVIGFGALLLILTTIVAIDLGMVVAFLLVGYRPTPDLFTAPARRDVWRVAAVVLVVGIVVVSAGVATAGQAEFERNANEAIDDVVFAPEYQGVSTRPSSRFRTHPSRSWARAVSWALSRK